MGGSSPKIKMGQEERGRPCTVLSFLKAPLASFCSSSELAVGCWNDDGAFCMRARFSPLSVRSCLCAQMAF